MNSKRLGFILLLFAFVLSTKAKAQEDLIILDEGVATTTFASELLTFAQKTFFINGGGFWSGSGDKSGITQSFAFARAGFDYSFDVLGLQQRLFVAGGYSHRAIEIGLRYEEATFIPDSTTLTDDQIAAIVAGVGPCELQGAYQQGVRRSCEFPIKSILEDLELREAYGSFEVYPDVVFNIGRQRPVWGQFDIFSVVNNILPIESQSKEFGVSNLNLRMPQDIAQLNIFLFERLELSVYAFYGTTLDPILDDALTKGERYLFVNALRPEVELSEGLENIIDVLDIIQTGGGSDHSLPTDCRLQSRQLYTCAAQGRGSNLTNGDKLAYATRAVWHGNSFTAGFTFYDGYYSIFGLFNRLPTIQKAEQFEISGVPSAGIRAVTVLFAGDRLTEEEGRVVRMLENGVYDAYNVVPSLTLTPARAYGLEFSMPINNWTIKAELTYSQTAADIGVDTAPLIERRDNQLDAQCEPNASLNSAEHKACQIDLFEWIINSNGSKGYVDLDTLFIQVGFSADYEPWQFGLNFIIFENILDSKGKTADRLYKLANPNIASPLSSGEEELERIPFPTGFVFYNFGEDNKHRVGFVAGWTGVAAGVTLFYTGPLYLGVRVLDERINWTISADYTASLSSQLSAQSQEYNNDTINSSVGVASALAFAVRAGATFEF